MIPFNNVTRDTVLQISIDQCYAKERFWQEYEYIRMWQEYVIHHGPNFQKVKNMILFSTLGPVILQFFWIANCSKWIGALLPYK